MVTDTLIAITEFNNDATTHQDGFGIYLPCG